MTHKIFISLLFIVFFNVNTYSQCDKYFDIRYDEFERKNNYKLLKDIVIKTDKVLLQFRPEMKSYVVTPVLELAVTPNPTYNSKNYGTLFCKGLIFLFEDGTTYKLYEIIYHNGYPMNLDNWNSAYQFKYNFAYKRNIFISEPGEREMNRELNREFYKNLETKRIKAVRFIDFYGSDKHLEYVFPEEYREYFINIYSCYKNYRL
jgi:hypothetical protein